MNILKTVVEPDFLSVIGFDGIDADSFIQWFHNNEATMESRLTETGAIKCRGVQIDSVETFQKIVHGISSKFLNYIDGNSPRTRLSGNVYTSTEYDKTQRITMHNELSYSAKWPGKLFFSCLTPAETGGETLVADSRLILKNMNAEIVNDIKRRGIAYIRNLHGGKGVGPSWQDTFETSEKKQLETYCDAYGIRYEWRDNDNVRLIQPSKGIICHRKTNEEVWFNQIDQFHPYQLGEEMYDAMQAIYETPEEFPMYVRYNDGKEITEDVVREILKTIDELTYAPQWEKNELLILDNELICHGRNPYSGDRKVLVAMSE